MTRAFGPLLFAPLLVACSEALTPCARPEERASCPSRAEVTERVTIVTSEGELHCEIDRAHAPRGAAHFLGWASGEEPFVDASTGARVDAPLYRDLVFFRAISRGYIQSGCQRGDGTTTPGFRFPLETTPDDALTLAQPGALALVPYHAPPNREDPAPPPPGDVVGSQFIVTTGDMRHLAGLVTVLGACHEVEVAARIATRVEAGERPRLVAITRP